MGVWGFGFEVWFFVVVLGGFGVMLFGLSVGGLVCVLDLDWGWFWVLLGCCLVVLFCDWICTFVVKFVETSCWLWFGMGSLGFVCFLCFGFGCLLVGRLFVVKYFGCWIGVVCLCFVG